MVLSAEVNCCLYSEALFLAQTSPPFASQIIVDFTLTRNLYVTYRDVLGHKTKIKSISHTLVLKKHKKTFQRLQALV